MLEDYINKLRKISDSQRVFSVMIELPLKDRFIAWWDSELFKHNEYSLTTLAKQFNTTPKVLSSILYSLGWTRHRRHTVNRPSCRFWRPPNYTKCVKFKKTVC